MVNITRDRRDYPAYALAHIQNLARREQITYRSWRLEQDIVNLGYSQGEVCRCIASLKEAHFQHSERPTTGLKRWQDVYHCHWCPPSVDIPDQLYVKLMVSDSMITLVLCSFHRHR